jgi:hypothetical protein
MEPTPVVPLWEHFGLSREEFETLAPSTRLALAREHRPPSVVKRRPNPHWRPSPEQQAALDQITNLYERLTTYREMEQAARTATPQSCRQSS